MSIISYTISANGKPTIPKTPQARKLYGVDMAPILAEANTTITTASIAAAVGVENDGGVITQGALLLVWVKGGTLGEEGHVTFRYTLSDGTIDEITLYFDIRQR